MLSIALCHERQRRADDQSDVFSRSLRSAAGMNSEAALPPCRSIWHQPGPDICGSSPCKLAIGCWTSRKRFSTSARP